MSKKYYLIIAAIITSLGFTSGLSYAAISDKLNTSSISSNEKVEQAKNQITSLANENIDQIKTAINKAIDKIIVALNQSKEVISTYPESSSSQQAIQLINETIAYLEGQQVKISTASSLEDLKAIQQATIQYLKDHQDEMSTAIVSVCSETYWGTVELMQTYLDMVKIENKALLVLGEIDQSTFDQANQKIEEADNLINQSTTLYQEASTNNDPVKMAESLKYLAQAGVLIVEIEDLLLPE